MAVYFIRPGRANQIENSRESYCHDSGVISIGWKPVGDLSGAASYEQIKNMIRPIFEGTDQEKAIPNFASQLWMFKDKISVGDYVVMPLLAQKGFVSIGIVTGDYKHQPDDEVNHQIRAVEWKEIVNRNNFSEDIKRGPFSSRKTVSSFVNIKEPEFRIKKVLETGKDPYLGISDPDDELDDGFSDGDEFVYETQLREFISNNIEVVEKGLSLYEDSDGNTGVEFPAGSWNIDVLAIDKKKNFVVIELKKSQSSDKVFGQIARYMGWVKTYLCKYKQKVRGVIIGGTITEELKYAAKLNDNVKLMEYSLSVSLKEV